MLHGTHHAYESPEKRHNADTSPRKSTSHCKARKDKRKKDIAVDFTSIRKALDFNNDVKSEAWTPKLNVIKCKKDANAAGGSSMMKFR